MTDLEDEQSWHPDGADLSALELGILLSVMGLPVILAMLLLTVWLQ